METLIKSTTNATKEMISLIKNEQKAPKNQQNKTRKERIKEQANNANDLPLISQTVKYLYAAAGFPVEDTWTKAIKAGNFNTWPTITPSMVQRHFPESDETQKGHMKKQRQRV
jgi:hypothetical protein